MTIKELMNFLENFNTEMKIIIASDPEGNSYRNLYHSEILFWDAAEAEIYDEDPENELEEVVLLS